jgi:nicotinamidase-related amidase
MAERVWDRFLTEQDRARAGADPAARRGGGNRAALLLVDLYRWVFGDEPQPLLDAIESWPGSCGLAAWHSLPHIERLLGEARRLGIPVVHVTGHRVIDAWSHGPRDPTGDDTAMADRLARRYTIVDPLAPAPGEVHLRKSAPSAFWGTPIVAHLNSLRVDTIVVAGESTSGCIRATVVDGKSWRYWMIVPEECVFDRDEAPHAINLYDMDQKYADVMPLDEVLEYLRSVAEGRPSVVVG